MIDYRLIYELYNCKGFGRVKINNLLTLSFNESIREKIDINLVIKNLLIREFGIELALSIEELNITKIENQFKQKIQFIDFTNKLYPQHLNLLYNSKPTILSCLGNLDLLKNNKIGFCGSRKATEKGHQIAKDISEQVSLKNITVVSGYASGIDLEVHRTSLCTSNGSTIIVLPEGLNNFKIKSILKDVWDWQKILVISEYLPDAVWSVNRAMERNSTIVALSDIMVLIEARLKGGSIDAGFKSLKFNKALFAPVYENMPEEASGNQFLLEKGAYPIKKSRETNKANLRKMFEIVEHFNNFGKNLFE